MNLEDFEPLTSLQAALSAGYGPYYFLGKYYNTVFQKSVYFLFYNFLNCTKRADRFG